MRVKTQLLVALLVMMTAACTVLNQSDSEKKIRSFVAQFEKSLSGDDVAILSMFRTTQTKEALVSAIRVLQNRDSLHVRCMANFDQAQIVHDTSGIRVIVHAQLSVDTLEVSQSDTTAFTMHLKPVKGKLVISQLAAEQFYGTYASIRNQVLSAITSKAAGELYDRYFTTAKKLQQTYDSVIWAASDDDFKLYLWVVKGSWNESRNTDYQMGLVEQDGKIIVPVKFGLVGTPGMIMKDIIEVTTPGGLLGWYNLNGDEVIPAEYAAILPYDEGDVFALVKKEETYFPFDRKRGLLESGLSAAAKKYITSYGYLSGLSLSGKTPYVAEIPNPEMTGNGFLMPPSYYVAAGYFKPVMSDFAVGNTEFRANTESVDVSYSISESIVNKVTAIMTSIESHYLEGRESFYKGDQVTFVNEAGERVGSTESEVYGSMVLTPIDSEYVEIKSTYSGDDYMMGMPDTETEVNIPSYHYYRRMEDGEMQLQKSNRQYAFTEFVKIDDSYLDGDFKYYDHASQSWMSRSTLSDETLREMRNEILASYGYIFQDEATLEHFKYYKWYQPVFSNVSDFQDNMSEIDKYNLDFLSKKIGPVEQAAPAG